MTVVHSPVGLFELLVSHLQPQSRARSPSCMNTRSCRPRFSPRFRGFHRYDLTTCIACERCLARVSGRFASNVGKQKAVGRKGFQITSYTIDYTKCMVLWALRRELPGRLSCNGGYLRFELLQPRGLLGRFFAAAARCGLGPGDTEFDGCRQLEGHCPAGPRGAGFVMAMLQETCNNAVTA